MTPVATIRVQSDSSITEYSVELFGDGSAKCPCMSWRYNRNVAPMKTCKHTIRASIALRRVMAKAI